MIRTYPSLDMLFVKPMYSGLNKPKNQRNRAHFLQAMLCKHRRAVISAVMLVEGESKDPNLSATTQTTLSKARSFYDGLMGPENPLSAEGTVALTLLGITEGLAEDPGTMILLTCTQRCT